MQFYTISFTSKKTIQRYDSKGRKIGSFDNNITQTIHCLPLELAKLYENRPNYRCEPFVLDDTTMNEPIEPVYEVKFEKMLLESKIKSVQCKKSPKGDEDR